MMAATGAVETFLSANHGPRPNSPVHSSNTTDTGRDSLRTILSVSNIVRSPTGRPIAYTVKLMVLYMNRVLRGHRVQWACRWVWSSMSFLLPCSIRKWKYGHGEKFVFEIMADSDCRPTTLKTWKKVVFRKVSLCVSVCLWQTITAANSNRIK